ncbi:MAG: hypothetical protein JWN44_2790 [Myxococcales bacterium]|nr:hypothetical protein [Myxococcales bacterium]
MSTVDTNEGDTLAALAHDLRSATAAALSIGSWFAPTLDDCRVDVERLLALDRDHRPPHDVHLLQTRAELALRTWSRIVAVTGAKLPRCGVCAGGILVEIARPGRTVPFRGVQIELPADFAIPTCDHCGAETLDAAGGARLDTMLMTEYLRRT